MILSKIKRKLTAFDYRSYRIAKRLSVESNLTNLLADCQGKTVFCIGAGPSLDHIDLTAIRDSTVFLLNSSVKLKESFDISNGFYWVVTDVYRFWEIVDSIPMGVKKILIPHCFCRLRGLQDVWKADDILIKPPACFRRGRPGGSSKSLPNIKPCYVSLGRSMIQRDVRSGAGFRLLPATVMLNAMALGASLDATQVVALGFDVTGSKGENHVNPYARGAHPGRASGGLNQKIIFEYLERLKVDCDREGVGLFNWSPLTEERILDSYHPEYRA